MSSLASLRSTFSDELDAESTFVEVELVVLVAVFLLLRQALLVVLR